MIPEAEIGQNIRQMRQDQGLSLNDLARKTNLTKGYLSRVETSDKAPPVSTLIVIAEALGVGISEIFGENRNSITCSLLKKGERRLMARDGTVFGYSYESLAHNFPHKCMEPYILTIPADSTESAVFQHKGEELLLVVQGTMRFFHAGEEFMVETGDCVYFDSSFPHYGLPVGEEDVKCFMVIYVP